MITTILFATTVCFIVKLFTYNIDNVLKITTEQMGAYNWDTSDKQHAKYITSSWNEIQATGCCGVNAANDWDAFRRANLNSSVYPSSCCHYRRYMEYTSCTISDISFHRSGCAFLFSSFAFVLSFALHLYTIINLVSWPLAWRLHVASQREASKKSATQSALRFQLEQYPA